MIFSRIIIYIFILLLEGYICCAEALSPISHSISFSTVKDYENNFMIGDTIALYGDQQVIYSHILDYQSNNIFQKHAQLKLLIDYTIENNHIQYIGKSIIIRPKNENLENNKSNNSSLLHLANTIVQESLTKLDKGESLIIKANQKYSLQLVSDNIYTLQSLNTVK